MFYTFEPQNILKLSQLLYFHCLLNRLCSVLTDSALPQNWPHRSALVSSLAVWKKPNFWVIFMKSEKDGGGGWRLLCLLPPNLLPTAPRITPSSFTSQTAPRITTPSSPSKQLRSKPFSFSLQFQLTVQFVTLHTGASLEDLFEGILDHAPWKAPTMQTCWASGSYLQTTYHLLRFAKLSL